MHEEKAKLEASNDEKDKRIASFEAELGQMRKEHEVEMTKLRQSSAEVAANLSSVQVKIDDLKDEIGHVIDSMKIIGFC
jgi:chromosome segregation ATPase